VANEEVDAKRRFELADLPAQGGLRDVEFVRGFVEAAGAGNLQEIAHFLEIHR
jgi:hypothetical protein